MVLKATNLQKTYHGKVEAVKGISLSVNKGEIFGFLGPNGAGKSTCMKMFIGLLKPSGGTIEIFDHDSRKEYKTVKDLIGYVPQDLIYYSHLTIRENLELFAACYELDNSAQRIEEILKLLQIEKIQNRKSQDLSGGQKRRINLAIGLLNKPKLLFLDEPSAGMDPQSRRVLWNSIRELAKSNEISIVLTTHLMETADKLSDRIAIIDQGEIKVVDTPKNLKERYGSGETIQIQLDEESHDKYDLVEEVLSENYPNISLHLNTFRIGTSDAVGDLSQVLELVQNIVEKKHILQISINETTLEDVFIKITGSALRE